MKDGIVELSIQRLVAGGFGLARTDDGVVLVRGALPGERVTARPREQRGVLRAHAIEILEPHPERVTLDLPPGADLPVAPAVQAEWKRALVVEALERVAKLDAEIEATCAGAADLAYRTAAQYAVLDGGGLGARAPGSDRLIALETDPLLAAPLSRAFEILRDRTLNGVDEVVLRGSLHADAVLVGLIGAKGGPFDRLARTLVGLGVAGVTWGEPDPRSRFRGRTKLLEGTESLLEDLGGILATVTVASFSQVNPAVAGALFREAASLAGGGARALDLYAGSGILGLHLARTFDEVIAIEIASDAIRRGKADARRLGVRNVSFEQADARTAGRFFPAEVVVVDPPRAGLSPETVTLLAEHAPPRIVYVSCDPTSWARDVGRLVGSGYRLSLVRPYDFYPYTHHVEVLSLLER